MLDGTATLFAGKGSPIGLDNFSEILNRGYTIIDKTLLIADFIDCVAMFLSSFDQDDLEKQLISRCLEIFFRFPSTQTMRITDVNCSKIQKL